MKISQLKALNEARREGRATILITDVESGAHTLIIDGEASGDIAMTSAIEAAVTRARNEDRSRMDEVDGRRLFIQVYNPPRRLIVVGAAHIAQPLVPMAKLAGFAVTVVDPRSAWATPERFPDVDIDSRWPDEALADLKPDARTAVVTLTHDPKLDDPALDRALKSPAFYIGALGSRRTHAARLKRLRELGHTDEAMARIQGPVGLNIEAVTAPEIALSIIAEIVGVRRGASLPAKAKLAA
jgi:xanthine dehydrogenase accessory factor